MTSHKQSSDKNKQHSSLSLIQRGIQLYYQSYKILKDDEFKQSPDGKAETTKATGPKQLSELCAWLKDIL